MILILKKQWECKNYSEQVLVQNQFVFSCFCVRVFVFVFKNAILQAIRKIIPNQDNFQFVKFQEICLSDFLPRRSTQDSSQENLRRISFNSLPMSGGVGEKGGHVGRGVATA